MASEFARYAAAGFFKTLVDTQPNSTNSIGDFYGVNGRDTTEIFKVDLRAMESKVPCQAMAVISTKS